MTNPITGKTILLGVTGSIAAYKAAELASKLAQADAKVDVILTESALHFITPLTFQSVTARKAYTDADLWGGEGHVTHIGLGRAGDLLVVAPASANTIARMAQGIGDNLLTIAALAARCPLIIAPAMDGGMYAHPATQANLIILQQRGAMIIGPAEGHLASGLTGPGRMVEPLEIFGHIRYHFSRIGLFAGKKIVVSAGGTQEPLDPVRVITNRSSGQQGYALAQAALDLGADVVLVSAPTNLEPPIGTQVINIRTAAEMQSAILSECSKADLLIMAAAVADFRPENRSSEKIKKDTFPKLIELSPTDDILKAVSAQKMKTGFPRRLIGFAAESQDLLKNSQKKLVDKNLDMIVANNITAPDSGFEVPTNRVTLIAADGGTKELPLMQKYEVAEAILARALQWF